MAARKPARKPAIQMTNGIDDIIKGGAKLLNRYGARRTLGDNVVTSASKAVRGRKNVVQNAYGKYYAYWKPEIKAQKKAAKNFRGTQFPKNQSLTPRKFKKVYGK